MADKTRLLIFIVAYNAEKHIQSVLDRIPRKDLNKYDYEILIIDDQSKDATFEKALSYQKSHADLNITVLYNPENQGYGGNQKLGYHYAVNNQFDVVLLLHGDGQYAPEEFDRLVTPIAVNNADAVFGSRMMNKRDALKGKMPFYKFVGNIVLTKMQNYILGTSLSEFHSGYRAYKVASLASLPIERNSNDFHFDTQIIIQLVMAKMKIKEVPIPTHYGDEICYVNGTEYAFNIIKASIHSRLQMMGIYYKREYDLDQIEMSYKLKKDYYSSHSVILNAIDAGSNVLEIGGGNGLLSSELVKKNCNIKVIDEKINIENSNIITQRINSINNLLVLKEIENIDYIILLDLLETINEPEKLLDQIRALVKLNSPTILISVANIGFFITRFQLFMGGFNYGKKGILDLNHKRLYTLKSIKRLCEQSGMKIQKITAIPAPYPEALGNNFISRSLLQLNRGLIFFSRGLFGYEFVISMKPKPVVANLIKYSQKMSEQRKEKHTLI